MREFFIFAGPQAAGKTTVIESIDREFRHLLPLFPKKKNPVLYIRKEKRGVVDFRQQCFTILGSM